MCLASQTESHNNIFSHSLAQEFYYFECSFFQSCQQQSFEPGTAVRRLQLCLHSALSIAADARKVVTVEQAVLRSQAAEFMALLARRATRQDADHDFRALESAARCEWVRKFTHMHTLHSAVIARHTFTPDTINAIRESNLPNALEGIGLRARRSDAHAARALDNKSTRTDDNDVIVRALVLLSHSSNEEEFDSAVEAIHEMFLVGVDPSTRVTRWSLLTENWLVAESNTLKRVLQKKKTLMANVGEFTPSDGIRMGRQTGVNSCRREKRDALARAMVDVRSSSPRSGHPHLLLGPWTTPVEGVGKEQHTCFFQQP